MEEEEWTRSPREWSEEERTRSPREWSGSEVSVELRDRRVEDAGAGHDSLTGVLGPVNELGVIVEEIYCENAGEEVRITSFVPWGAIRRITLRA
jgi:hypothetical protein